MENFIENFRNAMAKHGLDYAGPIIADGRLRKFKANGDRRRNSWYVLFPPNQSVPAGAAFGCHRRGFKENWNSKLPGQMTDDQWRAFREGLTRIESERQRAADSRQARARKTAEWILRRATPVASHPYLARKAVGAHGELRMRGAELVLPLRDAAGVLQSLQFIAADKRYDGDRDKDFLSGARIAGTCFTVSDRPDGALVLCEGYATGASIFEATGFATVCAMNCGNLLAIAKGWREKFPAREIIIAADNDQWTDSNPGLTKATEAAKAIGAKLAVPQFSDTTGKPTDFNDLAALAGIPEIKRQIESAAAPRETDVEMLQRLATLPPLEYERLRESVAARLGTRVSTLDRLVEPKRSKPKEEDGLQGDLLTFPEIEPWPTPVNGAEVLSEISATFPRYVVLPAGAADATALWAAHTHCYELFVCSPRLNPSSPERRCGKTTFRDVLSLFVPRPIAAENLTSAVLFRMVQKYMPTLLADECDSWMRENEELRGMLNSGHRQGGRVFRCEGDNHDIRGFDVFGPVALCGIGSLPGTLHDRSIVIRLKRALPDEVEERFDPRNTGREQDIRRKLARFIADNRERIAACDPKLPGGCFNRSADNWRPLFAIAEIAGGEWPQRAAAAFAHLTANDETDTEGPGVVLLTDIYEMFRSANLKKVSSAEIANALAGIEGREWAEWGKARRPITPNQLAKLLRRFNIASTTIRLPDGSVAKGYHRDSFSDAFARYLSQFSLPKRYNVTMPVNIGDSANSETLQKKILRFENDEIANNDAGCNVVTFREAEKVVKEEGEELLL